MTQFLKYTLATITGIVTVTVVGSILFILLLIGAAASGGSEPVSLQDNSVLVVNLAGEIVEHVQDNPVKKLLGEQGEQQGVDEIVKAIDAAATHDEIKGIYIECGMMQANTASLQEIRGALQRFKAKNSGGEKWIVAYANEYSQGAYYVSSIADKVWINPQGMLDLHGLSAQPVFLKDLLAKVGVKMKVVKVGKYKSATEQYTEEHMSDANREQVTRYIGGIWNTIATDISKSRGISVEEVNRCADELTALQSTEYLTKHKLIDKCIYADDVKGEIKKMLKIDQDEEISQVECSAMAALDEQESATESNMIAVYQCEGSIVQSPEAGVVMGDAGIVSYKMIDDLEKLAKDENVKAVVIRINSGGGDAFASEEIWHAVTKLKAKKPVVVSMGGAAASGAYYLSAGASWIVAQPTTLTGSIGIFGCFPDVSGLLQDKLGIKYDNVKTNKHADFDMTQRARPFNAEEEAMLQAYIDRGYEVFCKRVSDGRKIPIEKVKEIAQGRVWLGTDALNIKLVDQIGGLKDAIAKAATLAKLKEGEYSTLSYPEPASWMDQLFEEVNGHGTNLDEQLRATLGAFYEPFTMVRGLDKQSPIQARMEFVMAP